MLCVNFYCRLQVNHPRQVLELKSHNMQQQLVPPRLAPKCERGGAQRNCLPHPSNEGYPTTRPVHGAEAPAPAWGAAGMCAGSTGAAAAAEGGNGLWRALEAELRHHRYRRRTSDDRGSFKARSRNRPLPSTAWESPPPLRRRGDEATQPKRRRRSRRKSRSSY